MSKIQLADSNVLICLNLVLDSSQVIFIPTFASYIFLFNFQELKTPDQVIPNFTDERCKELWERFLRGDKVSFESIYKLHIRDLLNYGYKVTSDRTLIEDSIQDLFYEMWQSRENLSQTSSIKFYLFRALRYKIVRNTKDKKIDLIDSLNEMDVGSDDFSHENYLIGIESQALQTQHLKELIARLPKRQQESINLRYYHNFSNEEIAAIMEVTYQSACKFIYTGLKSLRLSLKQSALSIVSALFLNIF